MKKDDQRRIVKDMLKGLGELMLGELDKVPEHWDGHELRQWLVDTASEQFNYRQLDRKRLKEYRKERAVLGI